MLPMAAFAQRTVTAQLNTATLADTTSISSLIEIRGAVDGNGGVTLPDDNIIDWNDTSTLEPSNAGGDYWDLTFQIPDDAELQFKFYSQQAEDLGIGGWEDGDNHVIPAGTGDVDLGLHFFVKGEGQPYDWRPFESKQDSVGIWFRVFVNTEDAINKGFDRTAGQTFAVRGGEFSDDQGVAQGPLDWGTDNLILTREGDDDTKPGFDLYSGVAYYPASLAGMTQEYKYYIVEPSGWEDLPSGGNRSFTIPASDSTLQWVYYSDSAPAGELPVTANVIFAVDTTPLEQVGLFSVADGDTLQVRGDFNGWDADNPDDSELFRVPGENLYENLIPLTALSGSTFNYKFFIEYNDERFREKFGVDPPNGWEEPISTTGSNRRFEFTGDANADQDLGIQFFNDIQEGNIIPEGTPEIAVTFSVNMASAVDNASDPFVPGTDSVYVDLRGDALWAFTQDNVDSDENAIQSLYLMDDDGDMVYTGTLAMTTPTYSGLQYKYGYGTQQDGYFDETGGGFSDIGRRRTRYVAANTDGSWPAEFAFPQEDFIAEGLLPFEQNPVSVNVELTDAELPSNIALSQNYPNPFNPVTTFEYTIDRTMDVSVRIFDVMGREVAVLVDGVQQASSYRVNFDASDLASGVYLYRLETPAQTVTRQMTLLK